jgi:hypothetical protein
VDTEREFTEDPPPMSGVDLADCLKSIGWSVEAAAQVWDVRRQTVQRWIAGKKIIPEQIATHAKLLADFHHTHPCEPRDRPEYSTKPFEPPPRPVERWESCRIGSCQRHEHCMYVPCRNGSA